MLSMLCTGLTLWLTLLWAGGWTGWPPEVPFNPNYFMMMLLKTNPVENVACACVAEDCDAQGVGRCWVKGSQFLMLLRLWDLVSANNVVLIWSVGGYAAVDSPGLAAAATMASSSAAACLHPQQRQLKGTCHSSWTSSVWMYWAGLSQYWPTFTRQDVKCSDSVERPARLFFPV